MEKAEKEKIKITVLFRPFPYRNIKFQKNCKKIHKIKKHLYGFISSQYRMEKVEKEREQKLSLRFVLTRRVIENSKKIEKKFRKFKITIAASFQVVMGWNRPRNRENKNYDSASFQPDA